MGTTNSFNLNRHKSAIIRGFRGKLLMKKPQPMSRYSSNDRLSKPHNIRRSNRTSAQM
jgi:hypothetical protein